MGGDTLLSITTYMCTGYKDNLLHVYIHILIFYMQKLYMFYRSDSDRNLFLKKGNDYNLGQNRH